jgi:O-antigen/teichoic acid export membrane protein
VNVKVSVAEPKSKSALIRAHWLTRGASWVMLGRGASFLIQAVYFLFLAQLLTTIEYGKFSGAFALINTVTPYSSLGAGMLFMRYVTHDRSKAGVYWGNALLTTICMTTVICGVMSILGPLLTGIHQVWLFVLLTFANCLFGQIPLIASTVFQSFEKMHAMSALNTLTNLSRLFVLIAMKALLGHATAMQWTVGVTIASFVAAAVSLIWVSQELGIARYDIVLLGTRMREGLGFSVAGTTQAMYNDIDKTVLSHDGMNTQNGFYTLAYRIIDFITTPIGAIDLAVLPRFFRLSREGKPAVLKLAMSSMAISIVMGLVLSVAVYVGAPLLPHIVAHGYEGAVAALKILCLLPLMRGLHSISGSALTGMGRQGSRTAAQFIVAAGNLIGNVILIPRFGWVAAAYLSVASDGLLAVLNLGLLAWVTKPSEIQVSLEG